MLARSSRPVPFYLVNCSLVNFSLIILTLISLLFARPAAATVLTDDCSTSATPAATLLFPYVESDLVNTGGRTTLLAVTNQSASFRLARVVLWSELGIPVLSFDVFLRGRMTQSMNLRDLLNGNLPSNGTSGEVGTFPGCASFPPFGPTRTLPVDTQQRIQAFLSGRPAPGTNLCASYGYGDNIARGYVTVDVVDQCSPLSISRDFTPASPNTTNPYFAEGGGESGIARSTNVLTGDFFLVDPAQNYAAGAEAVHIVADPARFPVGSNRLTFYGHYSGFDGRDERAPLPSVWRTRYLNGGAFTGGTDLIVWHPHRFASETVAFDCDLDPYHFPVGHQGLRALREDGTGQVNLEPPSGANPFPIGRVTQRLPVTALGTLPASFGTIELNLDLPEIPLEDERPSQGWVMPIMSASGKFSVGLNAHPIFTNCPTLP